jgi:hypothetical protein
MEFKNFLLNENKSDFAVKVGEILSALQDVYLDIDVMTKKDIFVYVINIVNNIRPLLKKDIGANYLISLQKIATALMKDYDEKNDPKDNIYSSVEELKSLLSSVGLPINKINITKAPEQTSEPAGQTEQTPPA